MATTLGSFPVTTTLSEPANGNSNDEAGTASVDVVLPADTPTGTATLVVSDATGTHARVLVPVTGVTTPPPPPPVPVVTTVGGAAKPFRYGDAGTLNIVISRANATGQVDVFSDTGAKIGSATITAGKGVLTLAPKSLEPGVHELTLKYLGTSTFAPSQATVDVRVLKAKPKVKVKVDDTVDKAGGDEVVVRVTAPDGIKVTGKVKLIIKGTGKSVTVKLVKGKAVIELPKIGQVGTFTLKAKYLGSDLLTQGGQERQGRRDLVAAPLHPNGPSPLRRGRAVGISTRWHRTFRRRRSSDGLYGGCSGALVCAATRVLLSRMNHDRKAELVRQRNSVRLAFGASVSLVAGSLAIVAGTVAPAQAVDLVNINLVGINDFHGRIDANTVKWAGTVKKLEYEHARCGQPPTR